MKPEIAELWAKDLESNPSAQGQGALFTVDSKGKDPRYCCLGRLCQLYCEAIGEDRWITKEWTSSSGPNKNRFIVNFNGADGSIHDAYLPAEVQQWAGLNYRDPELRHRLNYIDTTINASSANDNYQMSFSDIAAMIRRTFITEAK